MTQELGAISSRRSWNSKGFDKSLEEKDRNGKPLWMGIACPRCEGQIRIPLNWHKGEDGYDYHPMPTRKTFLVHTKLVRKAEVPIDLRPPEWDALPEGSKIELPCAFLYGEVLPPLKLNMGEEEREW